MRAAMALVRLGLLLLPPGPVRSRYAEEQRGELWGEPFPVQVAAALSFVAGVPALHRSLVATGVLDVPHAPWWCLLLLHHRWRLAFTEDGGRYRACRACGLVDDGTVRPGMVPYGYAVGNGSYAV